MAAEPSPQTSSAKVTWPPRLDLAALYAIRCRFGCADPVVAIVHVPEGCVCWPDPVQALCAAHLFKAQSPGPIAIVADYRE